MMIEPEQSPPRQPFSWLLRPNFLISALGGSRTQIGGPTGAFVVIVAGIIGKFGLSGLHVATLMAGAMLLVMGLTGFGNAVKFIPRPVTIGFTNGIALLIASTGKMPGDFFGRMLELTKNVGSLNLPTTAVARVLGATAF